MQVTRFKFKHLNRMVHTTPSVRSDDPRSSKYYAGDIFEDEVEEAPPQKRRGPTKFDWMRINEVDVEDLPEMPDLETYQKEDQYWKNLEAEDFFPQQPDIPYKLDQSDTNDSELPYAMVR